MIIINNEAKQNYFKNIFNIDLTTQLVIQYNRNWIEIQKNPEKRKPKKRCFLFRKNRKQRKIAVFLLISLSKNGLFKPKNPFYSGGGEI